MPTLAIVAYPTLADLDRQWIESIRSVDDPQASRIAVHFTLVFPVDTPPDSLIVEASTIAASARPIALTVRRAQAMPDHLAGGGHVFLMPDEGADAIIALHDRLYAGIILRPHLRSDIPFVPHMTIAANPDLWLCESLAQEINAARRTVRGTISALSLIDVSRHRIDSIMTFQLGA